MCRAWISPQLLCRRVCEGYRREAVRPVQTQVGAPDPGPLYGGLLS